MKKTIKPKCKQCKALAEQLVLQYEGEREQVKAYMSLWRHKKWDKWVKDLNDLIKDNKKIMKEN